MKHGSLFSGIGGFDLAAEWVGWENVFQVEWDDWCQKVLTKNFPDVKKYKDIKDFDGAEWRGRVDVISGGFPCQPFSQAGKRQGKADNRYLWPEMLRVISEIKPTFVVGENVAGILSMENGRTLERILFDLEDEGYQVEVFIIPACAIGAWHRRDRVWIIAHNIKQGQSETSKIGKLEGWRFSIDDERDRKFQNTWITEPDVDRMVYGIPDRVDRIKGLGNAIVPQIAYEFYKIINQISDQ